MSKAVELRGPTILIDQLSCLSVNTLQLSQWPVLGPYGYVKTRKANWFVALTRFASDRGLVQIIESLCKYVFAATVSANFYVFHYGLSQVLELVLALSLKFLDRSGLV